jgi:digalactosyldiacylglycerol synthase
MTTSPEEKKDSRGWRGRAKPLFPVSVSHRKSANALASSSSGETDTNDPHTSKKKKKNRKDTHNTNSKAMNGKAGRRNGNSLSSSSVHLMGEDVVEVTETDHEVANSTYLSMAKLISEKFASTRGTRLNGVGLLTMGAKNNHGHGHGHSHSRHSSQLAKRTSSRGHLNSGFVNNLELLWKPQAGAGGNESWGEWLGWDEVKGNWRTFSTRQRRKIEKAIRNSQEDFALRDLLNRSSVVGSSLPMTRLKRSVSDTELVNMVNTEAAAMRIQKYVNYRVGKNYSFTRLGSEGTNADNNNSDGRQVSPLQEDEREMEEASASRKRSVSFVEDFETFARASATLRSSLAEFSNSFQEIAYKAKQMESKGAKALTQNYQDKVGKLEKSLQNYTLQPGYPRLTREVVKKDNNGSTNGSSTTSGSSKNDLVIPWSILPGVLRAWEKLSVDELALQISSQKQLKMETNGTKRKRRDWSSNGVSLKDNGNFINIFTTASLPWMTGTAVNPLLRAAYLSRLNKKVTLVVPWLSPSDQSSVYPKNISFESPEQQESYVMNWIRSRVNFEPNFKIKFYPAVYAKEKGSLLPVGDITNCVPDREADIAILEEPEHLNWYHPGRRWNNKFQYVVGIVHTNYLDYVSREEGGNMKSKVVRSINSLVCRAYCDKVIKLSGAVQHLPKSEICNVHGVSPKFLESTDRKDSSSSSPEGSDKEKRSRFKKGVYFMGKALWAKGYSELLDLLAKHKKSSGSNIPLDVYGSGPDFGDICDKAKDSGLSMNFLGAKDHQDSSFRDYKVFINPSLSDVVATTTAEALAMGKFVIVAEHPSNHFFSQFPNCLVYKTEKEFSECVDRALEYEPSPLSQEDRYRLTWEAATERLINIAEPGQKRNITSQALDQLSWTTHHLLANFEQFRKFAGAGSGTKHAPDDLKELNAEDFRGCGFFDRVDKDKKTECS